MYNLGKNEEDYYILYETEFTSISSFTNELVQRHPNDKICAKFIYNLR